MIQVSRKIEDDSGDTGVEHVYANNLTKEWTPDEYLKEMRALIWSGTEPIVDVKRFTWDEVTYLRTRMMRCVEDFVADFLKQDLHRYFGKEYTSRGFTAYYMYKVYLTAGLAMTTIETPNIKGVRVCLYVNAEVKDLDINNLQKIPVKVAGKSETLFIPSVNK